MQTLFYIGSANSVPTSSTQATHLRFSTLFVKTLYKVWTIQGQPFPCVQESFTTRDPRSLNPFSLNEKKERRILSWRERYYNWRSIKIPYWICKCLTKESFWGDKTFQFRKTLYQFRPKSYIYIGLWWPFKIQMIRCDYWRYSLKILSGNQL